MDEIKRRARPSYNGVSSSITKPKIVAPVVPTAPVVKPQYKYEFNQAREDIRTKSFKKFFNNSYKTIISHWKSVLILTLIMIIAGITISYQIGSLTGGVSSAEQHYISGVNSGKDIIEHPSYLLHKIPTYVLFKLNSENIAHYRLISASFGFLAVFSFYHILRYWHSKRVSVFATLLFITSPWLLHSARLATPDSIYLLFLPLLWTAAWMYNTNKLRTSSILLLVIGILCLYIPGFIWIILFLSIWKYKTIVTELKQLSILLRTILFLGVLIGISPLIYASIINPSEFLVMAGLPSNMPSVASIWSNIVNIPKNLVLSGPTNSLINVGSVPLIDVFSATMFVFGIYSLRYNIKLIRAQVMFVSLLLFVLLVIAGGPVGIISLLPLVYLLIAGGMSFIITQWLAVFPRNPLARGIAVGVMSALVLLVTFYQLNNYFVAWAKSPDTRSTFTHSLL